MSFYTWLSAWAAEREVNAEAKRRKQEMKKASRLDRPVTHAGFQNGMNAFCGEVFRVFDLGCQTLIQRVNEVTAHQVSDMGKVFVDYIRDKFDAQQTWIDNNSKLYENSMSHIFNTFNDAAELRHKEADRRNGKRTNVVVNMMVTAFKQNKQLELKIDNAVLELAERIRRAEEASERRDQVNFTTQTSLFENLVRLIQHVKEPEQRGPEPTLDWLMANIDEVLRFAKAMNNIRENNAPQDLASMTALKSIRAMLPDTKIIDARDAIFAQTREWGVAA